MSKTRKRVAVLISGLALVGGGIVAATTVAPDEAEAASCYGGAQRFDKARWTYQIPTGNGWWKTTSRCNDINVKGHDIYADDVRYMKVCFQNGGCQDRWTAVKRDQWKVVASNVKTGTKYRLRFKDVVDNYVGYRAN